jgi:hypothetical protein
MATAATPTPMHDSHEITVEQFQFTKQGQTLCGVLQEIEPKIVNDKSVKEFLFRTGKTSYVTLLATADLEKKLRPEWIGYQMTIRYEADDTSFKKEGQNAMKRFKVVPGEKVAA